MKLACWGFRLIERGKLHLKCPSCGLWLIEQGILHLKRACFDVSLIERRTLPLKRVWNGECQKKTALYVDYRLKNEE